VNSLTNTNIICIVACDRTQNVHLRRHSAVCCYSKQPQKVIICNYLHLPVNITCGMGCVTGTALHRAVLSRSISFIVLRVICVVLNTIVELLVNVFDDVV